MIRGYWFLYGPIIISILYYLISLIDFSSCYEHMICEVESLDQGTKNGLIIVIIAFIELFIVNYVRYFSYYGSDEWKECTIGQKIASFLHIGFIIINLANVMKSIHIFLDKHLTIKLKK